MNTTGHDRHSFILLLNRFKYTYDYNMMDEYGYIFPKDVVRLGMSMGSPRQINTIQGIGMVLMWYCAQGSCFRNLDLLFGQTYTSMYKWLKFSRRVLLHVISRDINSKVIMPSIEDVRIYNEVIGAKYLLRGDVWGAADGIKQLSEAPGDEIK